METVQFDGHVVKVVTRPEGEIDQFEIVKHPGAVCILAYDEEYVYLVRQPRPAVGEAALLELPAGTRESGEHAMTTAKRELAEEIGKGAREWKMMDIFYTSPGYCDEMVWLYFATDLYPAEAEADATENIEVVKWPLDDISGAIDECNSVKCKYALMLLRLSLYTLKLEKALSSF